MTLSTYKSIFISDLHIGTRAHQAVPLINFLKDNSCENLYMVGDIIDGWALKRSLYLPKDHIKLMKKILKLAKDGTNVHYIAGNHDEFLRDFLPMVFNDNIVLENELIYESHGKKYLVIHGDQYDQVVQMMGWLAVLGDILYTWLVSINSVLNWFRKKFGLHYWSLSQYLKHKVKSANAFIGNYEHALARACKERSLDGIICGHIHFAEIKNIEGIEYMNCGDGTESCTALVEHHNGKFEIVFWNTIVNQNAVV